MKLEKSVNKTLKKIIDEIEVNKLVDMVKPDRPRITRNDVYQVPPSERTKGWNQALTQAQTIISKYMEENAQS